MILTDQELAFRKLSRLKVGALFMETGTGKTKVALDLMASKLKKVSLLLWICPCSLKGEFESERKKWHPELDVEVVGCESIGSSSRIYLETLAKVEASKAFVVVDESLKIKNRRTKRTDRIIRIGKNAAYKLILNGTPLTRNVLDVWAQMEFLSPKILKMDFWEFRDRYCEYYRSGPKKGRVKANVNISNLVSVISPYIFDAELEIKPSKFFLTLDYPMPDIIEYERIKSEFLMKYTYEDGDGSFYGLLTKLQAFYCRSEGRKEIIEKAIGMTTGKVIVFVKYLTSIPEGAHSLTGETKNRDEVIEAFRNGDFSVLWMTYGVGAFGLNLQFCSTVIFADHSFDYAQRIQAEARVYRHGQENDVLYISLRCDCGLEKMIFRSMDRKENLLDRMKSSIMLFREKKKMKRLVASL